MKKIMFNDKYGLTKAVLKGRKTQTRRIVNLTLHKEVENDDLEEVFPDEIFFYEGAWLFKINGKVYELPKESYPKYNVGEIVAIAQSYKDAGYECYNYRDTDEYMFFIKEGKDFAVSPAGVRNKMFVAANLMPHQIRITDVRIERLQDISDEDCLKEGIIKKWHVPACRNYYYVPNIEVKTINGVYNTSKKAYAVLIDKVSGKWTWQKNPYVFVYDFELVK